MARKITLPLTEELAKTLHAGDQVLLTGTIYTSRDAGHKRMCEALARGEELPFDPTDATIYYVGPTPAKPGQVIGSAGPTTSGRMDAYAPTMIRSESSCEPASSVIVILLPMPAPPFLFRMSTGKALSHYQ